MQEPRRLGRFLTGVLICFGIAMPRVVQAEINCFENPEMCEAIIHAEMLSMRASPVARRNIFPARGISLKRGRCEICASKQSVGVAIADAVGVSIGN
ncbi:MAG: hypothetical protein KAI66_22635, partial [Lentisphaeria bacterium]|nr:hypothetical protein [Lentisphaeria bacterium]